MGGTCSKQLSTSKIVGKTDTHFILEDGTKIEQNHQRKGSPDVVDYRGYAWELGTEACSTDNWSMGISSASVASVIISSCVAGIAVPGAFPIVCMAMIIFLCSLWAPFFIPNSTHTREVSNWTASFLHTGFLTPSRSIAKLFIDEPTLFSYRNNQQV